MALVSVRVCSKIGSESDFTCAWSAESLISDLCLGFPVVSAQWSCAGSESEWDMLLMLLGVASLLSEFVGELGASFIII